MAKYTVKKGGMHDKFRQSRKKIQVIGGGFGNGKTAAVCVKAIQLALDYPGSNGFIGMATYAQLNDTIREEYYKWVPNSAVKRWPTMADNTLVYHNGSRANFRYLQQKGKSNLDGTTTSNLLSATYDYAVVDQMENPAIVYKDYLDLLGRLRGTTEYRGKDSTMPETGPRWLIMTANPAFNWFYHKVIQPAQEYRETGNITENLPVNLETGEVMIDLFEAPTQENKHNLPADFIQGMEANYKGVFADRFIGGEWGAFEGLVYPDFQISTHTLLKDTIKMYMMRMKSMGIPLDVIHGFDFGIASPSCYLFGFRDHRGRVFIIDGFYKTEMTLEEIAKAIVAIWRKWAGLVNIVEPIMADPAIFKRNHVSSVGKGAETIANLLTDFADLWLVPGQNDILNGVAKLQAYLAVDDFPHFETGEPNGRMLYFASDLSFVFNEFGAYFWASDKQGGRVDKPIDKNDHAMDTLKYMFSRLPDVVDMRKKEKTLQEIYRELA
jgi:hypothetical protein